MRHPVATKDYGDTNFITGMRAYAAFAVVLIHAGGAGLRELGAIGNNIVDMGRTGVYVFFVISGFSVASSFALSDGYGDYLHKRLWRIAPLYYFWLAVAVSLVMSGLQPVAVPVDAYNILMHVSFLSFLDYRIANSIIGAEWSIPIEVFWYLFVPFMLGVGKNGKGISILLGASFILYIASARYVKFLPVSSDQAALAMHWSPIPYVLSYSLGILAYRLRQSGKVKENMRNFVLLCACLLLAAYPVGLHAIVQDEFLFTSFLTFALITCGSDANWFFRAIFANKIAMFLGTISYGIYLCHFPVLWQLGKLGAPFTDNITGVFVLLVLASTAVATLTYVLIEQPVAALVERRKLKLQVAM